MPGDLGEDMGMQGFASVISPQAWSSLVDLGTQREFAADEILMRQGEDRDRVILLLTGRVKISLIDAHGHGLVLAIRGPGEALGEVGALGGPARSSTVTAVDSCATRIIAMSTFRDAVATLGLAPQVHQLTLDRFRESEQLRLELATRSAEERVLRGLLRLAVPAVPGGPVVDVGLDQTEFGRALGLSRQSVANCLAELRRAGLIATRRNRIILRDLAGLTAREQTPRKSALCPFLDTPRTTPRYAADHAGPAALRQIRRRCRYSAVQRAKHPRATLRSGQTERRSPGGRSGGGSGS